MNTIRSRGRGRSQVAGDRAASGNELFARVSHFLCATYDLQVEVGKPSATGLAAEYASLQNGKIRLSPTRSGEQRAFLLAHIYGHLVQHSDLDEYLDLIAKIEGVPPIRFDPSERAQYFRYELEASAWGEALMRSCSPVPDDLLNRYRAYVLVDFDTYFAYLRTGRQTDPNTFQRMVEQTARREVPQMWELRDRVLPSTLLVEDLHLAVL